MIKMYGLKNCDTCRKALKWMDAEGIAHEFLDLRKGGLDSADVKDWLTSVGDETLINRRGTTWRQLTDNQKSTTCTEALTALIMGQPAIMKRPVFVRGNTVVVGFKDEQMAALTA